MPTTSSQYESFSMANMIPQYYSNNRGNWKSLEEKERALTLDLGKTTVVSGTFGSNGSLKTSDIPKYVFKIIKSGDYLKVYIINNDGTQDINVTDIDSLSNASGYVFKY
jgi:endonuclease G